MPDIIAFPATTPRHDLPLLAAGQAQKEFFVNEALARIDTQLHPAVVAERDDPPAAPEAGQCWLVGGAASAQWSGHGGELASWDGEQWTFCAPARGQLAFDESTGQRVCFTGQWTRVSRPAAPAGGAVVDAEARAAITELFDILATLAFIPAN